MALVARLPKLDPLLAGSTTLSVEIVLGRKLMWPGQTSVVAVSPANRVGRSGGSIPHRLPLAPSPSLELFPPFN